MHPNIKAQVDTGYQGIKKQHSNSELPKKRSKRNPLTKEDKMQKSKDIFQSSVNRKHYQRIENL